MSATTSGRSYTHLPKYHYLFCYTPIKAITIFFWHMRRSMDKRLIAISSRLYIFAIALKHIIYQVPELARFDIFFVMFRSTRGHGASFSLYPRRGILKRHLCCRMGKEPPRRRIDGHHRIYPNPKESHQYSMRLDTTLRNRGFLDIVDLSYKMI